MRKLFLRTAIVLALAGLGLLVAGFTNAPEGKKVKMTVTKLTSFKRMYGMPAWTPVTPPDVQTPGQPRAASYLMGFFEGQYEVGKEPHSGIFAGIFQGSSIIMATSPLVPGTSAAMIIDAGAAWLPVTAGRGSTGAFVHGEWPYSSYTSDSRATKPIEYYLREFDAQGNPVGPAKKILSSPPPKPTHAGPPPEPTHSVASLYPYSYENSFTFAFSAKGSVFLGMTENWSQYTLEDDAPSGGGGPLTSQFWQLYTLKYAGSTTQWKKQLWKSGAETDSVVWNSEAFDSTNWAVGSVATYEVPHIETVGGSPYPYFITKSDLYSFYYTYGGTAPAMQAPAGRKVVKIASTDQDFERSYQSAQVLLDETGNPANMIFYQFRDLEAERHCTLEDYVARYFFQPMKNGNASGDPIEITVPVWNHKIKASANIETDRYDELISELVPVGENRYLGFMSRNLSVKPASQPAWASNPAAANAENQLNVVLFNLDKKTGSFVGNLMLGMIEKDYLEKTTLMSMGTDLIFYVERVNSSNPDYDKWRREACWASATVSDFIQD